MLIRGKISHWFVKPDHDDIWNEEDWGRAATYEALMQARGISETERRKLIPCAVWAKKFVGLQFCPDIMKRLQELSL